MMKDYNLIDHTFPSGEEVGNPETVLESHIPKMVCNILIFINIFL